MIARLTLRFLAVLAAVALGATGCGGGTPPAPKVPDDAVDFTGQAEVTVASLDNKYVERIIVVTAGTDVTWVNEGRNRHNVLPSIDGRFEPIPATELDDGGSATRTFDTVGEFAYYCSIHGNINRGQRGWVYVLPAP
ncbi:MAG: hypothetical protein HKN26_14740 [Acidimicrobiales bacterium]|nr:hypothetical protein [Acidimicrobiales bacterium]